MTIFENLYLRFHGYCPKHLTKRSFSQRVLSSYCGECVTERHEKSVRRSKKVDEKAQAIIAKESE